MLPKLLDFLRNEDGPTTVEYAVMMAMILMACMSAIFYFGQQTVASYNYSSSEIERTFPDF